MTTPESRYREIIFAELAKTPDAAASLKSIYEAVQSSVNFDEDDLTPPTLRGRAVNEPSWRRNVRNTLQAEKDQFRLSNFQKGWWKIAPGPPPGQALDVEGAWVRVLEAANRALQAEIEFSSPSKGHRYRISDIDSERIAVERIDGNKPAMLGKAQVRRSIGRFNAAGCITGRGTLINTVALETALVSLHPQLQWSPDAESIVSSSQSHEALPTVADFHEDDEIRHIRGAEGIMRFHTHRRRERNRVLIDRFKNEYISRCSGTAPCQACGFDFRMAYGELGANYIEAHHIVALSKTDGKVGTQTSYRDLAFLCANCHRMSHRLHQGRWPTLAELRQMIESARSGPRKQ